MLEGADDPAETTTWLEHITEDEYRGATGAKTGATTDGASE